MNRESAEPLSRRRDEATSEPDEQVVEDVDVEQPQDELEQGREEAVTTELPDESGRHV